MSADRVAAINPTSTIQTPYGNSVSNPAATQISKTQHGNPASTDQPVQISCQKKAQTDIQYRSNIVDTDAIADAVCADAVSKTSIPSATKTFHTRKILLELFFDYRYPI